MGTPASTRTYDRVVASGHDLAVVQDEQVGDRSEPLDCLVVAKGNGFLGQIARSHHERAADFSHDQVMQRRVRKHQPEHRIIGRDFGGEFGAVAPPDQDNGPLAGEQDGSFGLGKIGQALGLGEIAHHHGQRLLLAAFAAAKAPHRGGTGRVAGEVKPANSPDCDNPARGDRASGGANRVGLDRGLISARIEDGKGRAAAGTRVGLGMEAAIGDGFVLATALGAHRETRHGGSRPIVGNVARDGEARPAIGAVGERVAIAAVGRIENFGQAIGANRDIGRDRKPTLRTAAAADYFETFEMLGRNRFANDALDSRGWRR